MDVCAAWTKRVKNDLWVRYNARRRNKMLGLVLRSGIRPEDQHVLLNLPPMMITCISSLPSALIPNRSLSRLTCFPRRHQGHMTEVDC